MPSQHPTFVIAVPYRTDYYTNFAHFLISSGDLRVCCLGTRNGFPGIPKSLHRLQPLIGLASYAAAKSLPPYISESFRFSLYPWFDSFTRKHLLPGDNIISSYAHANKSFKWVRSHGGKTFLDAGNSHPQNFWDILTEEHLRWNSAVPPVWPRYIRRAISMMNDVDYVLAPSSFVADSFVAHGFKENQILRVPYAVDLSTFSPPTEARPKNRPLTIINTGGLSLRKGSPYLLEAFRIVRKHVPDTRLLLTDLVTDSMRPLMKRYADLPIEWSPPLPHAILADRLRSADVFVFPSLEDGWARTVSEAMACGLPCVVTPNTGAKDSIVEGAHGSIVPIRDAQAIAESTLHWWDKIQTGFQSTVADLNSQLSLEVAEKTFTAAIAAVEND